jgi:hypothetical protein
MGAGETSSAGKTELLMQEKPTNRCRKRRTQGRGSDPWSRQQERAPSTEDG